MEDQKDCYRLQKKIEELTGDLLRIEQKLNTEIAARERAEERMSAALAESEQTKQECLESEQHYKMLIENTHDVVYSVTTQGIMTYLSPQMIQFGYKPEELISKNFIEFVAPEQRQEVINKFKTGTAAGESFPTQFEWIKKDGSQVWVEVVGKTIFDEAGIPKQQIGVIREIEERKQQEEKARSLFLLLDTLDAECFIKDKDGVYQYINKAFEVQFGVKKEDVIGNDDVFVFGEETAAILWENDQRIMASKKSEAVEEAAYLQDEKYVVYLTNKTPIIDETGEVVGLCGAGVDITHQKEIEKQLRESEEKYRSLVEQISEVIYAVNMEGEITYMSPSIEAFLGYSPEEVVGKRITQFVDPEEIGRIDNNFQRLSAGVIPGPNEYKTLTKSGQIRWMRTSSHPVMEEGQIVSIQGVITDITNRKLAEEQLSQAAANAERERLARELHDSVTQTLYSTAAISEALPRIWERDQEQARSGLGELETLTHAALAEMRTLLLELRPSTLEDQDLTELLRQLIRGLKGRTNMPVTLELDEGCSIPSEVKIALYRITQESLNNIIKHARADQAQVRLDCEAGLVKLTIKDDGVGFNPQSVTSHRLGLEIMRERADSIDAGFEIQSQFDQGTEICVTWQEDPEGKINE